MAKLRKTDIGKNKLKKQITSKETVKSAKLVLTILFVALTALFSFGRTLNSYTPAWLQIPTWPQIYEIAGLHLEEYMEVPAAPLIVAFIDVGQGDCTFIKTEDADILIDTGEFEYAESVLEFLRLYNVDDLEYVIVTHPHSDHIGALPEIMREIAVEEVVLSVESNKTTDGIEYRDELLQIAREKHIKVSELPLITSSAKDTSRGEVSRGEVSRDETLCNESTNDRTQISRQTLDANHKIVFEELTLEFLGPIVDDDNLNNTSLIVKLTFGKTSFLFTGDAEKLEEYTLLSRDFEQGGGTLKCDVLKVAHHGSKTSSAADFIEAVNPKYAVISCGADNEYGHPHSETLQRLESAGCNIRNTAVCGNIVFAINECNHAKGAELDDRISVWTEIT